MKKHLIGRRFSKVLYGQALIEVAILLPLLLLMVLGALDFGRFFSAKIVLTNAAREGVYYLTLNRPDDPTDYYDDEYINARQLMIDEALSQGVSINESNIQILDCCSTGNAVTVMIVKEAKLIFGKFLQSMGVTKGPVLITSAVEMMVP